MTKYVQVAGGSHLAYEAWGDPQGSPVFLLHGSPGSRFGPRLRGLQLSIMGIRLIAYDRPGYGDSSRQAGRRVIDAARDVEAIADALGLRRFGVVGRSGGGPHALACARALGDRVTAAAALVSMAPRSAEGLDWYAGMTESNRRVYAAACAAAGDPTRRAVLHDLLASRTAGLRNADFINTDLDVDAVPDADRRLLADPGIRLRLVESLRGATANDENLASSGSDGDQRALVGWLDDTLAFCGDWGFDVGDIEAPVLLWHGERDVFSPADHARWLAWRLPRASLIVEPGSAHFGALVVLPFVLEWLRQVSAPPVPRARAG